MTDVEWPTTDDVTLALNKATFYMLTAEQFGIFAKMASRIAFCSVNSRYSDAAPDPGLPLDEAMLRQVIGCTLGEWRRSRDAVLDHFVEIDGKWRLKDPSIIRISKPGRSPIPLAVKSTVIARDGRRCAYCGDTHGPFHFDHIFPLSRGGSNEANNITVACSACNMAKGSKTIQEWVQR